MDKKKFVSLYIGIFLISTATLILEISLVRVISVSQWHHFAYLVISIALLGLGAGGSFLFVFPKILDFQIQKTLSIISLLFCISNILGYCIFNTIPFDPVRIAWDTNQSLYILLYYLFLSIPFFFFGLCLAILFTKLPEKSSKLYFFNLTGSAIGCLIVTQLFSPLKGEGTIVFVSLVGGAAFFTFSYNLSRAYKALALVTVALFLALLVFPAPFLQISISPYKALKLSLTYKNAKILDTYWNSFSRVDIIGSPAVRFAPGLSLKYNKALPPQLGITIDGDNLNSITYFDGSEKCLAFTDFLPSALVYHLKKAKNLLIIGSNGGIDVLGALCHKIPYIEALEPNPLIINAVKGEYAEFSGRIYRDKRINVISEEGRSYIRKTRKRYDIINISLSDNPSAASTGLYSLKESYLYTVEAFKDFYNHLTPEGIFTVTRYLIPPPKEGIRLVSIAKRALEELGISNPQNHISLIRSWGTITFLLKKDGFDRKDVSVIKDFCKNRGFDTVYFPGIKKEEVNIFNRFLKPYYFDLVDNLLNNKNKDVLKNYIFDLSPVTDDNPFFFHFLRWNKIPETYRLMGEKWQPFLEGGYLLPIILAQAFLVSILLIFLPVSLYKGIKFISKLNIYTSIYFIALGFGFIFIEIIFLEKFILFLGHPVYSLSVILFSVLLFSGIGSYLTDKGFVSRNNLLLEIKNSLILRITTLVAFIFIYWLLLPTVLRFFLGSSFFMKPIITILIIAPIGLLMGMPFPLGIRITGLLNKEIIPLAFCLNGVSSILGSILSMILAIFLGFQWLLLLSALIYSLALLSILKMQG